MHIALRLKGSYTNIKNIFIENYVAATIKCTNCNEIHPKTVTISSESIRTNHENHKINFVTKCHTCDRELSINLLPIHHNKHVHWLDNFHQHSKVCYLSEKTDNETFTVAYFDTDSCEILAIKGLMLNVLAEDNSLFENITIEKDHWENQDKKNAPIIFFGLKIVLDEMIKTKK